MKKIVFGFIVCSFLILPAVCFGATGWYGSANVGYAMLSDSDMSASGTDGIDTVTAAAELDFDGGYVLGGAIGYTMEKVRIEGEISYQKNDTDSITIKRVTLNGVDQGLSGSIPVNSDVSIFTFLVNGYFDFNNDSKFTPYLTAGIGMTNVEVESEDDTVFAYQVGAGVGFAMSETVTLDCRYRYLGAADYEIGDTIEGVAVKLEASMASHNLTVGLRFAF